MKSKRKSQLISVIIPSYNHSKYILSAINSVLSQTYQNIELIVIDDGSKDNSPEIIQTIEDKRLIFISQKNQGAHQAINHGFSLVKGEYITILNSDDIYHPKRLEICYQHLQKNPHIDLVSTWIEVIDKTGKILDIKKAWHNLLPWDIIDLQHSFLNTDSYVHNLLATNFVATTSNIFMRTSVVSATGGMRPLRFAHDWDFLLRAAVTFQCQNLAEPLLQYRVHPTNTISQNRRHMLFEILWVLASNYPAFEGKYIFANSKNLDKDFIIFYNSLNLQHNDKSFWILRSMIESLRKQGKDETLILQDRNLISTVLNYIIE